MANHYANNVANIDMYTPTVSILIPTYNSAKTIEKTMSSIATSDYDNIEVIVHDAGSTDGTLSILSNYKCKIAHVGPGLLIARVEGIRIAKGDFILLLDSDMVLKHDTIRRAVDEIQNQLDAIVLEEVPIELNNLVDRMWWSERQRLYSNRKLRLSPLYGDLLPRFFRTQILANAVRQIPLESLQWLRHPDHQILYYETYKLSRRIGFVNDAIYYCERSSVVDVIKTYFRHGIDAQKLLKSGYYSELVTFKNKAKIEELLGSGQMLPYILGLLLMKSIPFEIGFQISRLRLI